MADKKYTEAEVKKIISLAHKSITQKKGKEYSPSAYEIQKWIDSYLKKTKPLKEGEYVWNAIGKKLVVDKVTKTEYYLSGFMTNSMPWSRKKVDEYIKTGYWTKKPI